MNLPVCLMNATSIQGISVASCSGRFSSGTENEVHIGVQTGGIPEPLSAADNKLHGHSGELTYI